MAAEKRPGYYAIARDRATGQQSIIKAGDVPTGHKMLVRRAKGIERSLPVEKTSIFAKLTGGRTYTVELDGKKDNGFTVKSWTRLGAERLALDVFDRKGLPQINPDSSALTQTPQIKRRPLLAPRAA